MKIPESELILNQDGSVYHLNLLPEDISTNIILVGDKDRVPLISKLFDKVLISKHKREFYTQTGLYKGKKITVISTGIGTDNIDIVLNELDALVNVDLKKREVKKELKSLRFVRIGTCGVIQPEIPVSSYIVSTYSLGFDNLLRFYHCEWRDDEKEVYDALKKHLQYFLSYTPFYLFGASKQMLECFEKPEFYKGITITAPGFFGPQGRVVRLQLAYPQLNDILASFQYKEHKILNFEMETSAIYGLSNLMNHHAVTVDLALANRYLKTASIDYHKEMEKLALKVLDIIAEEKFFPET